MKISMALAWAGVFVSGVLVGRFGSLHGDATAAVAGDARYTLANCVAEFAPDKAKSTNEGWQFWFVPTSLSKTFNFKLTEVHARSANHGAHVHPEAEIMFVFEGAAEFNLAGETKVVGPNSSLFCPSGVSHGIRNVGDKPLRYAIIKADYPPDKI